MNTGPDASALERCLAEILPSRESGLATLAIETISEEGGLLGTEFEAVARAIPRRRREFSAGRRAAHRALAALGCPPVAVPMGPFREPLWPEGYNGSISHDGGLALALAQRIDPSAPLLAIDFISDPEDRAFVQIIPSIRHPTDPPCDDSPSAARLFAAKEAAIKLISPRLKAYIEFTDLLARMSKDGFVITHGSYPIEIDVSLHCPFGALFALARMDREDLPFHGHS